MVERQDLMHQCIELIKSCGHFIKAQMHNVSQSDIIEKEKHSLVSYVDIEAEKMLVSGLKSLLPEAGFITEEGTQQYIKEIPAYWIIDPLDGTTNFLKSIPVFSVSVALVVQNQIEIGIVHNIMQDECFYASLGGGAFLNGKKISVSSVDTLEDSVLATGFPYARKTIPQLVELLQQVLMTARGVRRLGSAAIDLAYTACGRFDGYYETRLNPWDTAAGILLVREAGGKVSDFHSNESALWKKHHIIAANPHIFSQLLSICRHFPIED